MSRWMTAWCGAACAAAMLTAVNVAAAPAKAGAKTAAAPASMTGCLQADGGHYKLTGLPESQAPKGRSWKTAYVTRTSKDVEVMGGANLKLKDHVGHKVTIVGTRDGAARVKATSVKMVAARCS